MPTSVIGASELQNLPGIAGSIKILAVIQPDCMEMLACPEDYLFTGFSHFEFIVRMI